MPSTISALEKLEPFFGDQLQTMASLPTRDALDHWDANKVHMRCLVAANFNLDKMKGDHLAACFMKAFDQVWATIPPGRLSDMGDQSKLVRVLYTVASQMHAVRELLEIGGIKRMDDGLTPVVFRNRKSDDMPKPGSADGPLMRMAIGVANVRLKGGDVDKDAYAKQLRMSQMRIGCDDRSQHFKTVEGFHAGMFTDYGAAKTPVVSDVTIGGRTARVNKSAAGVEAFRVEAFGWDEMGYSMPIMIIRDLLARYGDKAIELVEAREATPLKKT